VRTSLLLIVFLSTGTPTLLSCSQDSSKTNHLNLNKQSVLQSTSPEAKVKDIKEFIVQKSIGLEKFQQYYHFSTNSERKPVYILQNKFFPDKPKVTIFNEPVEFATCDELKELNRPYIEFIKFDIEQDTAYVVFRYYVEGIEITIDFTKIGNKWEVKKVA
jgi:hypothetical protein